MSDHRKLPPLVKKLLQFAEVLVFPAIGSQLLEMYRTLEIDQKALSQLISQDPGITATILRTCNAANMPVAREIDSVERAINLMGAGRVFSIAFSQVVATKILSTSEGVKASVFQAFWRRSLLTALFSEILADKYNVQEKNAYTLGLLYHLGMIFFAESYGDNYFALVNKSRACLDTQLTLEFKKYQTDFEKVGYWVMSRWQFPDSILGPLDPESPRSDQPRAILLIASELANAVMRYSEQGGPIDIENGLIDLLLEPNNVPGFWYDSDFRDWYVSLIDSIRADSETED